MFNNFFFICGKARNVRKIVWEQRKYAYSLSSRLRNFPFMYHAIIRFILQAFVRYRKLIFIQESLPSPSCHPRLRSLNVYLTEKADCTYPQHGMDESCKESETEKSIVSHNIHLFLLLKDLFWHLWTNRRINNRLEASSSDSTIEQPVGSSPGSRDLLAARIHRWKYRSRKEIEQFPFSSNCFFTNKHTDDRREDLFSDWKTVYFVLTCN